LDYQAGTVAHEISHIKWATGDDYTWVAPGGDPWEMTRIAQSFDSVVENSPSEQRARNLIKQWARSNMLSK
jgi:hypothetical protein